MDRLGESAGIVHGTTCEQVAIRRRGTVPMCTIVWYLSLEQQTTDYCLLAAQYSVAENSQRHART